MFQGYRLAALLFAFSVFALPASVVASPAAEPKCVEHRDSRGHTFFAIPAINDELLPPERSSHDVRIQASLPVLHSLSSASQKIYLNFVGCSSRTWGTFAGAYSPPYDVDGNTGSLSTTEANNIYEIWQRVSEDYAPFNIDVTTEAPAAFIGNVAMEVCIGGSYNLWYGSSAGGVAYVGSWSSGNRAAWVFEDNLGNGNPKYTAEAISHEAGHEFGLVHQSTYDISCNLTEAYSTGSGSGETGWAPIMGVGYYQNRTTWHNGVTSSGCHITQDNLATITSISNQVNYRPDDHGDTVGTASVLAVAGNSVSGSGIITTTSDADVFAFNTGAGTVTLDVSNAEPGPNLDIALRLLNGSGQSLASVNPSSSLDASLSTSVAAGTYFLEVSSNGTYGSIGQYLVSGTIVGVSSDSTPPTAALTSAPNINASGGTTYSFTVQYADNLALTISSVGTGDVTVSGPNGFTASPTFLSVDVNSNGTPRSATYRFVPPSGGWDAGDNGTYTISAAAGQVSDTSGNTVAAQSLGTFQVTISGLADSDLDGVPDTSDNCPNAVNASQANFDGDSQGDACDNDDDNDGMIDGNDCAPFDAALFQNRAYPDGDLDGIPDSNSLVTLSCFGALPPTGYSLLGSSVDNCPSVANADQTDTDHDGTGNACDNDDDNDGVADNEDCSSTDALAYRNLAFPDADSDDVADSFYAESTACFGPLPPDGYTVSTVGPDNCPTAYNPDQTDSDADGIGDACFGVGPRPIARGESVVLDFDGDGATDLLFRNVSSLDTSKSLFIVQRSVTGGLSQVEFGSPSDTAVPGEYTGDRYADLAVVTPQSGALVWRVRDSSNENVSEVPFGLIGDKVFSGCDFSGDGITDMAVLRNGQLIYRDSATGTAVFGGVFVTRGSSEPSLTCRDVNGDGAYEILILTSKTSRKKPNYDPRKAQLSVFTALGRKLISSTAKNAILALGFDNDGNGVSDASFVNVSGGQWVFSTRRLVKKKYKMVKMYAGFAPAMATPFNFKLPNGIQTEGLLLIAPNGQIFRYGALGSIPLFASSGVPAGSSLILPVNFVQF